MRSNDILIVDDEIGIRDLLSEILQDEGYTVALAENATEARRLRHRVRPAMVLLDIWMPDCDGITLLKEWAKNGQLNMPVVMMSGHASIETAVEATKIGAWAFLEKPITLQNLLNTVRRALKHGEGQAVSSLFDKLGNSDSILELNSKLELVVKQNTPILLIGENGSPFELVARYFQKDGIWVKPDKTEHIIDIPAELLKKAAGSVLYLGDISQYSKRLQQGIGFLLDKAGRSNVRVIIYAAGCGDNIAENLIVDTKLCDALLPYTIKIPPLRSQFDDMAFLVEGILSELIETQKITPVKCHVAALDALCQYDWPGNFDQLYSVIKKLALNTEGVEISERAVQAVLRQQPGAVSASGVVDNSFDFNISLRELREELERRYFEYHIAQENRNMSRVAQKVGLERTHLYRKLKQLNINFSRKDSDKNTDGYTDG